MTIASSLSSLEGTSSFRFKDILTLTLLSKQTPTSLSIQNPKHGTDLVPGTKTRTKSERNQPAERVNYITS